MQALVSPRPLCLLAALLLGACSPSTTDTPSIGQGGSTGSGGNSMGNGGTTSANGGNSPGNGGTAPGSGGMSSGSGGTSANGGATQGGATASVGGKTSSNGGSTSGGATSASGGKSNTNGGKSSGGSNSGGTTSATGGSNSAGTSSAGAPAGATELCARWKSDRMNLTEDAWTGDAASCNAGDMSETSRASVLRLVNLYRWIAQLPAVAYDANKNQQDQACALMMQANGTINHSPPNTWKCYTAAGATAAGSSNLAGSGAISAVDAYMLDPGNATTIGHRRWILSNSLGPIGVGSTGKYSCMWTLNGTGKAGKQYMAWPSAGVFPLQAFTASRQSVDATGWSIQSDSINLAGAQVTVTFNGAAAPVTVTQLDPNYGSRYALRFNPMGWTSAVGTYHVAVSGITTPIEYDVNVVNCN